MWLFTAWMPSWNLLQKESLPFSPRSLIVSKSLISFSLLSKNIFLQCSEFSPGSTASWYYRIRGASEFYVVSLVFLVLFFTILLTKCNAFHPVLLSEVAFSLQDTSFLNFTPHRYRFPLHTWFSFLSFNFRYLFFYALLTQQSYS